MAIFDLYSVAAENFESASTLIERALSLSMEVRESSYHGGTYFFYGSEAGEHLILKYNLDPFDGAPAEQAFPESKILLYVNDTQRSTELRASLGESGAALIRHEDL